MILHARHVYDIYRSCQRYKISNIPLLRIWTIYTALVIRVAVYQPLMHAKCIISQARQVIVGEDNGRNSQYIRLLGECLIEKCWSISTMNGPIICPIQSFMVCRAFHGEIIWEIPRRNFSQLWTSISMISQRRICRVTWLINLWNCIRRDYRESIINIILLNICPNQPFHPDITERHNEIYKSWQWIRIVKSPVTTL